MGRDACYPDFSGQARVLMTRHQNLISDELTLCDGYRYGLHLEADSFIDRLTEDKVEDKLKEDILINVIKKLKKNISTSAMVAVSSATF